MFARFRIYSVDAADAADLEARLEAVTDLVAGAVLEAGAELEARLEAVLEAVLEAGGKWAGSGREAVPEVGGKR